ncbi:MAG TPA: hypothetical protein VGE11_09315 [Pseudonocardia sp.]
MPPEPSAPASTTPVQKYLDRAVPGVSSDYLVIPRSLAQSMPLRWQQVFVGLLADLHDAYGHLTWPEYRVVPSRWEIVADLDEGQLGVAGIHADLGPDGALEYRDADERLISDPERHRVLAPVRDPLPPVSAGHVEPRPAKPL